MKLLIIKKWWFPIQLLPWKGSLTEILKSIPFKGKESLSRNLKTLYNHNWQGVYILSELATSDKKSVGRNRINFPLKSRNMAQSHIPGFLYLPDFPYFCFSHTQKQVYAII